MAAALPVDQMDQANRVADPLSTDAPSRRKRKRDDSEAGDSEVEDRGAGDREVNDRESEDREVVEYLNPPARTWFSSTHHHPSFYDCLPHIYLTRRALEEFDRRINLSPRPNQATASLPALATHQTLQTRRTQVSLDLKRFARLGGPDLSELRGFELPSSAPTQRLLALPHHPINSTAMAGPQHNAAGTPTQSDAKTNAYDLNFATAMEERNFHNINLFPVPINQDEVIAELGNPRPTNEIWPRDKQDYEALFNAIETSSTESMVMSNIFPLIRGPERFESDVNKPCVNWSPLFGQFIRADNTPGELKTPQPDYFNGEKAVAENAILRQHLNKFIVPGVQSPFLPNFFLEAKGPKGKSEVVKLQALYAGSLGSRGMFYTRKFSAEDEFDTKACTFSVTFESGALHMYAHFVIRFQPTDTILHWHMAPLRAYVLDSSIDQTREGIAAFRNLQDLAKKIRTEVARSAIDKLNTMKARLGKLPTFNPPLTYSEAALRTSAGNDADESEGGNTELVDTSEDELAA